MLSTTTDDTLKISETGATNYALPDGNMISLKEEKIIAPEMLFNPSIVGLEYLCTFLNNS